MEVIYFGMGSEYNRYQLIYIVIAYQLCKYHLLAAAVTDEGKRETLVVGFYFGRKPVDIAVRFHLPCMDEHRAGLVIGVVECKRAVGKQQAAVFATPEGF